MALSCRSGYFRFAIIYSLSAFLLTSGCGRPDWFTGTGGKYNEARMEITKRRGGNIDKAITNLEAIVQQNPTYRDSLTLLGRAYYKKERYSDAAQILERAIAVNKDDDIAWLVLGLARLRSGADEKGLQAVMGGLTLYGRASMDGYMGHERWDRAGKVKSALGKAVFAARKGLEDKDNLIVAGESLLRAIDEEEFYQRFERTRQLKWEYEP